MDAQRLDMGEGVERCEDRAEPAWREHQRVAAGQDDLSDIGVLAQPGAGGVEFLRRQQATIGADLLAAEAEAAIDRADQQRLEQRAVGVAVDDAAHRRERLVGDWVRGFVWSGDQLVRVRHELTADRVVRVDDQVAQRRRNGDRIADGHRGDGVAHGGGDQACSDEGVGVAHCGRGGHGPRACRAWGAPRQQPPRRPGIVTARCPWRVFRWAWFR